MAQNTELELPGAFTQLGYDEQFWLQDMKIAFGYGTVAIAAGLFWLEKKFEFNDIKMVNAGLIGVYFILLALMWFFSNLSFKNIKYIGVNKQGDKVTLKGWTTGYDPHYRVKLTVQPKGKPEKTGGEGKIPFEKIYDGMGYLNRDALLEQVKGELTNVNK